MEKFNKMLEGGRKKVFSVPTATSENQVPNSLKNISDTAPDPLEQLILNEEARNNNFPEKIPEDCMSHLISLSREIFKLRAVEGFSFKEIADQLFLTEREVQNKYYRARNSVFEKLQEKKVI